MKSRQLLLSLPHWAGRRVYQNPYAVGGRQNIVRRGESANGSRCKNPRGISREFEKKADSEAWSPGMYTIRYPV